MAAPTEQSMADSDSEITPKRKRNVKEWKTNKAKRLRAEGKEYENRKGEVKNERKTGDKCRCRRDCLNTFTPAGKELILKNFNTIGSQDGQDAYLYGHITAKPIQRRRPGGADAKERSYQFYYKVKLGEDEKVVCREAFASLHGIGTKRVRRISDHVAKGQTPKDKRGIHNNHRVISEELKDKVDQHIRSFPYRVSHYGGTGKKRRYLSSELSITKMYTLFLELCYPEKYIEYKSGVEPSKIDCEVKFRFYYDYYRANFNYGFGRPRSDVCCECTHLDAKIKVEKTPAVKKALETEKRIHKTKATVFYDKMKECRELAKSREDTDCICFDFKQNIPFPHLPTGDVFYSRQLWLFVFGINSAKVGKGKMYTWPETQAKRGANEVISCLDHFIKENVPETVKNLFIFTDGCRGQNHNHTMLQYLQSLVLNDRFDSVVHQLPIRGHSYLPCDREFALIEKDQRKRETVELHTDWEGMIAERFPLVSRSGKDMRDFKGHLQQFFKKNTVKDGEKFTITKYKSFTFSKDHKYDVVVSENMSRTVTSTFRLLKPKFQHVSYPDEPLYNEQLPVKAAKLADVSKLAQYLSQEAHDFISGLEAVNDRGEDESDFDD